MHRQWLRFAPASVRLAVGRLGGAWMQPRLGRAIAARPWGSERQALPTIFRNRTPSIRRALLADDSVHLPRRLMRR
jgi:hypothetical protein